MSERLERFSLATSTPDADDRISMAEVKNDGRLTPEEIRDSLLGRKKPNDAVRDQGYKDWIKKHLPQPTTSSDNAHPSPAQKKDNRDAFRDERPRTIGHKPETYEGTNNLYKIR